MENMQKLTWEIWRKPDIGKTLLIGGLLAYVPVLNLLLMGYYGRWVRQLVLNKGMDLPEWKDGRLLLKELIRVLVPIIVWGFCPMVLAFLLFWAIAGFLNFLHLGFFAMTIALLPVTLVCLLCPPAITVALIRLYKTGQVQQCLDIAGILQTVFRNLQKALFPVFQYYGILALGWPLIGFASFLATLPLLAQLILVYRDTDEDLKSMAN
jgi:hypothetical protein